MRFETIILLIIAFNVVTAILQRRAKKKRAEQAAAGTQARREETFEDFDEEAADEVDEWAPEPRSRAPESVREPQKMPGLGRDILDQIARDLGLKVPRPARPEPVAVQRPKPTRSAPPEHSVSRRASEAAEEAWRSPERPYTAPRTPEIRVSTAQTPRRATVPGESAPSRKIPTSTRVPRVNLRDPAKLREAFVLKEVLGEPVSRKRGR